MLFLHFLAFSCKPDWEIKFPKGVQPIDWENYNDVYTVYWNFLKNCSEPWSNELGKDIKVCGWIFQSSDGGFSPVNTIYYFCLINKEENIFADYPDDGTGVVISVVIGRSDEDKAFIDSLKNKFATSDITKKCYIKGKLSFETSSDLRSCYKYPQIVISNADDIYFE